MLASGADKVYYIEVSADAGKSDFDAITDIIPNDRPVVCESPSLINYVNPGVFVVMINDLTGKPRDLNDIRKTIHFELTLSELDKTVKLPFSFTGGGWTST
jgi:hypothetical protein